MWAYDYEFLSLWGKSDGYPGSWSYRTLWNYPSVFSPAHSFSDMGFWRCLLSFQYLLQFCHPVRFPIFVCSRWAWRFSWISSCCSYLHLSFVCVLAEWGVGGGRMSICRGQRSTLVSSQPFFSFVVCDRIPHWTCIHISASMAGEWGPIFSRVSLSSITSAYRCAQMLHGVAGHMNPGTPASSQTVLWTEPTL